MNDFEYIREHPDVFVQSDDETFSIFDADWDSQTDLNEAEAGRLFDILGDWLDAHV